MRTDGTETRTTSRDARLERGRSASSSGSDGEAAIDGRTARRQRNIDAVLASFIDLLSRGQLDPTAEEIAAGAGVSHRSIYRYFDSRSELINAVMQRVLADIMPSHPAAPADTSTTEERILHFVDQRVKGYWQHRDIARAAFGQQDPGLQRALARDKVALREHTEAYFAAELDAIGGDDRSIRVGLLDAMFQFDPLDYLAVSVGLDAEQMNEALTTHIRNVLLPSR